MEKFLTNLGLEPINPGAWAAGAGWLVDSASPRIDSVNPATGEVIASVHGATTEQYERVIVSAREIAAKWRLVPSPKRGEAVRLIADERAATSPISAAWYRSRWARSSPRATAKCRR